MLSGTRVVSFTHFLQGPSATQILGDLGADVIKIEPPQGAFERGWSGPDAFVGGVSVFFLLANRNARSMVVDLKSDDGRRVLRRLLDGADVLIESFRPGVMDRLGLGYEELRTTNPRLVYCSLSGYGSEGPYKDRPGQDVLVQSLSGLAAATGAAGGPPTPVGASVVDAHGAALGALGILAALHGRARTGEGTRVESNLLSAALDLQVEPLSYHLNGFRGERSPSGVSSRFYKAPYGVFATADGYLTISLTGTDLLAKVLDDPWFTGVAPADEYARREEVNVRVAALLAEHPTAYWIERFTEFRVWHAPVHDFDDVATDPQVRHNETILTIPHPEAGDVRVPAHPIRYGGERPGLRRVPPALGEHTREVLGELGCSPADVDALVAGGAFGAQS
ncbi:CaiB/BaiF CoA transferase family protein [Amycolatopsis eburnea]|uniref:CoA transferase n=1 Tax=Amycolatopsis eburnea TaxID=2267691 RepID=A0A3R9F404_9PSEU|nr:CaiB/BaiF CoA-transferase family protein [Amycolatopsis eburnea]RSD14090.1 CoA transferase [Amycolatopsis eburnea]